MPHQSFRRFSYENGVFTIERVKGTSRVFLSFHYIPDSYRVSRIRLMRRVAASIRSSDVRSLRIGQVGFARAKKRQRSEGSQGSWEIWRLEVGRIGSPKHKRQHMDSQSLEPNRWEKLVAQGPDAVKQWINTEMKHKSCVIVLIGSETADRDWINYEIKKGWSDGKGVFGVYIHNMKGADKKQSRMGLNPFDFISLGGRRMSEIVQAYNPPFNESKEVYDHIRGSLDSWIEEAIKTRRVNRALSVPLP
jgi:hypothetical protein